MSPREHFDTRYPGYDVLDKWGSADWDDQTRDVVRRRVEQVPTYRFFSADESMLLEAVVARIIPQPDRSGGERVPVGPWIDEKLYEDRRDGYRYEELPPLRAAWRRGLGAIEALARERHRAGFAVLSAEQQDDVLRRAQEGEARGEDWGRPQSRRFFRDVLCSSVARIYYAHPAAWSECGYNGPSSPRGHVRIWMGGVDPWEAHERGES